MKLNFNVVFSCTISPAGIKSCFKKRNSFVVVNAPYFSIKPWSSTLIPLCFKVPEFNFISIKPEIESPLKNVGYLADIWFLSVNLCLWRPGIS